MAFSWPHYIARSRKNFLGKFPRRDYAPILRRRAPRAGPGTREEASLPESALSGPAASMPPPARALGPRWCRCRRVSIDGADQSYVPLTINASTDEALDGELRAAGITEPRYFLITRYD